MRASRDAASREQRAAIAATCTAAVPSFEAQQRNSSVLRDTRIKAVASQRDATQQRKRAAAAEWSLAGLQQELAATEGALRKVPPPPPPFPA